MKSFIQVFESQAKILTENLKEEVDRNSVDILPFMKKFSIDVISGKNL